MSVETFIFSIIHQDQFLFNTKNVLLDVANVRIISVLPLASSPFLSCILAIPSLYF